MCTIGDPIEMIEASFNQVQVQQNIDMTFAAGVRALMRQDPDIVMVGEIRDMETADMAVQAALTGHLGLSTLHTNDAPSAGARLLDLGTPAHLLNATLLGGRAPRLGRTPPIGGRPAAAPSPGPLRNLDSPMAARRLMTRGGFVAAGRLLSGGALAIARRTVPDITTHGMPPACDFTVAYCSNSCATVGAEVSPPGAPLRSTVAITSGSMLTNSVWVAGTMPRALASRARRPGDLSSARSRRRMS